MNENRVIGGALSMGAAGQQVLGMHPESRTIGQNINARIAGLKAEIARLEGVREQLESGASLLDVRIEDLRQAINY